MASELAVTVIRLGYLVLLWLFVAAALGVLRRDVWGTVVTPRGRGRHGKKSAAPSPSPKNDRDSGGIPRRRSITGASSSPTQLIITEGALTGTKMPLGSAAIVIGRSPACTLVVDDSYASSQHARLYLAGGSWHVEDMNSTNGVFVDGERISSPRPVGLGSQIRIAQTTLELTR